jgi:hypothetical protein
VCWAGSYALDQPEPNVSQEHERLVVRLQASLLVIPSTTPAANSPKMTGRCQRRGNPSSRPMIATREITANLAKLSRIISGVVPTPDATAKFRPHDHPVSMLVAGG